MFEIPGEALDRYPLDGVFTGVVYSCTHRSDQPLTAPVVFEYE